MSDPRQDQAHASFRELRRRFMPPEIADSFVPLNMGEVERMMDAGATGDELREYLRRKIAEHEAQREAIAEIEGGE